MTLRRFSCLFMVALCAAASSAMPARANGSAATPECFDALISASIRRQTPTASPDCADCIVVSWPWIVDLDVVRVLKGVAQPGRLTVLAVWHTYRIPSPARRWWLRRNTLGGFNVLEHEAGTRLRPCARGAAPAQAFITPARGETLDDLRVEGERVYGPTPGGLDRPR